MITGFRHTAASIAMALGISPIGLADRHRGAGSDLRPDE